MSELCMGRNKQNAHAKPERVTRQCSVSNHHASTITCTAAQRVWHFSAFHYIINTAVVSKKVDQLGFLTYCKIMID